MYIALINGRQNRKRLVVLAFVLMMAVAAAGCKRDAVPVDGGSGDKLSVVATIFAPYDFSREIAGGKADITMLIPPASESHSFEPAPQDIIKIQNCDVFIYVGGESDRWIENILASMDTDGMKIVTLMDCVDVVEEEIVEGMQEENDGGRDNEADYDEHIWTSPRNAKLIVRKISDTLCEADEENVSVYEENTDAYLEKLDHLDSAFKAVTDGAVRKTVVFGDRFPFRYLTDAYGLDYYAAFPGCAAETEPSAATVTFLINKVNEEKIPVIFHAELSSEKMAETISEATGAKARLLHACHNISKDDFENGVSYMELMTRNVDVLKEALS